QTSPDNGPHILAEYLLEAAQRLRQPRPAPALPSNQAARRSTRRRCRPLAAPSRDPAGHRLHGRESPARVASPHLLRDDPQTAPSSRPPCSHTPSSREFSSPPELHYAGGRLRNAALRCAPPPCAGGADRSDDQPDTRTRQGNRR